MRFARVGGLFVLAAIAEILGCHLPWPVIRAERPWWLGLSAGASLALFAGPLTLGPAAAARTYAAYGGCLHRRGWRRSSAWR